jgi:dual specificity phosphatase 12
MFLSLAAALSPRTISERQITHIVSVCTDPIPADLPAGGIKQLRIPVPDVDYADLLIHFPAACHFIQKALDGGGSVLVHCNQGLSRSAA